jgi:cobalt-precorrin 5A hydrolase
MICFSRRGCELGLRLSRSMTEHNCEVFSKTNADVPGVEKVRWSTSSWTEDAFDNSDAVIFIGATGIAVRYIAPYLKNKAVDPAVICMDETGKFTIPLLSGHIGGANDLAREIAKHIGSIPVITTATDLHGKFAVDSFAVKNNLHIACMPAVKDISSRIVDDKTVGFYSDVPFSKEVPPELELSEKNDLGIYVSYSRSKGPYKKTLKLIPKCHILGIGCRKDVSRDTIEDVVEEALKNANISMKSVKAIASIDVKKDEEGLLEYCKLHKIIPVFYSAEELEALPNMGFAHSERVKEIVGVDNVCERAAYAASKKGEIVIRKVSKNGVSIALVREPVFLDLKRC